MIFFHPLVSLHFSVDGSDGADARSYDERNLKEALRLLAEAERGHDQR